MNLTDLRESKYLKREDVGPGVLATISAITQKNVAPEGAPADNKAVVFFAELPKPMVLNSTNGQAIAQITGKDTDIERNWIGARVVLYNDPNVSYAGKLVGGIRIRAPKPGYAQPQVHPQAQHIPAADTFSDGVPLPEPDGTVLPF